MREIHLRWTAQTVANSEYAPIAKIAHSLEVVGHLDIGEKGIRQLIFPHFCEGKGPSDLNEVPFLNVESELDGGQSGYLVVWNSHPLSIAAIRFSNIHILPPYTYGGEGIEITVRGVPSGVSQFLKTCRAWLPPDTVKVVEIESTLTPRQIECVKIAASSGYYDHPKKIKLRELSELMDIPRSTLQEHLNRAELSMMKWASEQINS
ncbi:helix-turn-helix domain-containing protein [Euryarchaeota archaeon]|nr:helix-turn-helix domain-containing protein [Euryarchaeota archaeon]